MSLDALQTLHQDLIKRPHLFTAQKLIESSVTPGFNPQTRALERQHTTLRFFSLVAAADRAHQVASRREAPAGRTRDH